MQIRNCLGNAETMEPVYIGATWICNGVCRMWQTIDLHKICHTLHGVTGVIDMDSGPLVGWYFFFFLLDWQHDLNLQPRACNVEKLATMLWVCRTLVGWLQQHTVFVFWLGWVQNSDKLSHTVFLTFSSFMGSYVFPSRCLLLCRSVEDWIISHPFTLSLTDKNFLLLSWYSW